MFFAQNTSKLQKNAVILGLLELNLLPPAPYLRAWIKRIEKIAMFTILAEFWSSELRSLEGRGFVNYFRILWSVFSKRNIWP